MSFLCPNCDKSTGKIKWQGVSGRCHAMVKGADGGTLGGGRKAPKVPCDGVVCAKCGKCQRYEAHK